MAIPHDIYVFGTQENSLGDKEWVDFLRSVLKDFTEVDYRPVGTRASRGPRGLWGCRHWWVVEVCDAQCPGGGCALAL